MDERKLIYMEKFRAKRLLKFIFAAAKEFSLTLPKQTLRVATFFARKGLNCVHSRNVLFLSSFREVDYQDTKEICKLALLQKFTEISIPHKLEIIRRQSTYMLKQQNASLQRCLFCYPSFFEC